MPRTIETTLRALLTESEFRFIPDGVYTQKELYAHVKKQYPNNCDDEYLCIQNCRSGHNSPEWQHVVRSVMQILKRTGRMVNVARGSWSLI